MTTVRRCWWVNQSNSYPDELMHSCLTAPRRVRGRAIPTWERMEDLARGDATLHFYRGLILAVGKVTEPATIAPRPYHDPDDTHEGPFWFAKVAYTQLTAPIAVDTIPVVWRIGAGPFDARGQPIHGYLFPLTDGFAERVIERFHLPIG